MASETTTEGNYTKPLPRLKGMTGEWFGWLKKHELRFQKCTGCGHWRHVPRELCPECGSDGWEWARSSGKGKLYTWTTTYRPMHPSFTEVPFAQVVIEMEEGPRVLSHIVGTGVEELDFDMPVEVIFDDVTPEVTLAKFRKSGG
ncbi:OB-fold domain-containing protein [Salipiger sp. P9]|uniref:Zn-ribbon domain-containing OB-fold protein n=1 Tax=Salipiger pentaromativorans TaxID=2943193 RepID=UPI00215825EC|nr:OB-fold domain-containing protein [Salipiger pentaromativorans]MCR8547582.1 OB-fold domain-containing protein [Salipiger pentaromativorans]